MRIQLRRTLEQVAQRFRQLRLWWALTLCWLAWSLAGAGLVAWSSWAGRLPVAGWWLPATLAALALASGVVCARQSMRSVRDPRWVARRIEARHPELKAGLLAAVEEDAAAPPGRLGFLPSAVIREALEHRRAHDWEDTVPTRRLRAAKLAHALSLGGLVVVAGLLVARVREGERDGGPAGPASLARAGGLRVEPGDTEIERGTSLLVVARFDGPVPDDATLVLEGGDQPEPRRAMTRSLEDPMFAGRVESVESDLNYRVEYGGRAGETYRVKVFEYPEVLRADASLVFPGYTAMGPKTVEDVRHVTAVEGTELTLICRLNKDVAEARLLDDKNGPIALTPDPGDGRLYRATLKLDDPRRLRVQLTDREGRANKRPTELAINVTRNKPAVVKTTRPARDVRVSPLEELALKAQHEDDFGVVRHGVNVTPAGGEPKDIVLGSPGPASRKLTAEHLIDFESLKARPDQLVTYYFWAEDVGPDGQTRRSAGDMFFAEVRPFEEIFRQGEQPSGSSSEQEGQQGGNAQQAMQLAELQKEIINGTWKLIRRETGPKPSDKFAEDARVLLESEQAAIRQADQLAARLQDRTSKANLEQAVKFMKDAERRLSEAVGASSAAALTPALAAEQAAYQALLKLRDREFNVVRGNSRQRGSQGSAGGPSQGQLQQLELSNEENRYEEQRSARARDEAATQQEREQQETRQILSRLRELAQRQADLNDRLKELQSALEEAKDERTREEIERQLKRLRDQQQQILRDTDELRERMEQEENRDRMAEAREQVEQGREHVRQASEALEQGRLSQALTEGTRAGRQLEDLRDELRKEASGRFSEEMTEMRDQARRLDEAQDELTKKLEERREQPQHRLRDEGDKQVQQGLEAQQKQLEGLLERMRRTVQEAEETEPRLAEELFDAATKADQRSIPDALDAARRLAELDVPEEAVKASRHAGEGLDQLREGVERAAESVLGDETEALRRAQGELDDLAEQLDREIAQSTGQPQDARDGDPERSPSARGQDGEGPRSLRPEDDGEPGKQEGQPGAQEGQEAAGGEGARGESNREGQREDQRGPRGQQRREGDRAQGEGQPGQQGLRGEDREGQPEERQEGQQGREGQQEQEGQQAQGGQGQGGQRDQQGQAGQDAPEGGRPNAGGGGRDRRAGIDRLVDGINDGGPGGPITGEGFRRWSDRMRDVEELLDDPELRAEAARIRDRVRGAREEFKRHAKEPDWGQLKSLVAAPIHELQDRVAEEVRRRESPDALVPIDRDPVPPRFSEGVRRYYERLGSGR